MSDTAGPRSDGSVDQLLLEAGLDDDGQLRPALLQLRALGSVAPEPSAEVAALLARANAATALPGAPVAAAGEAPAEATRGSAPADELAARRRAKRRVTLTALSLAASLSAGGAVAAASDQGFRDSFTQFNRAVAAFVSGSDAVPADNRPAEPAVPVPAVSGVPAPGPAAPAPSGQPADVPPSGAPAAPVEAAENAATPGEAPGVPATSSLPTAVPGDLTNGVGQQPQVPVPGVSDLSLPETLPAVPLR